MKIEGLTTTLTACVWCDGTTILLDENYKEFLLVDPNQERTCFCVRGCCVCLFCLVYSQETNEVY